MAVFVAYRHWNSWRNFFSEYRKHRSSIAFRFALADQALDIREIPASHPGGCGLLLLYQFDGIPITGIVGPLVSNREKIRGRGAGLTSVTPRDCVRCRYPLAKRRDRNDIK